MALVAPVFFLGEERVMPPSDALLVHLEGLEVFVHAFTKGFWYRGKQDRPVGKLRNPTVQVTTQVGGSCWIVHERDVFL